MVCVCVRASVIVSVCARVDPVVAAAAAAQKSSQESVVRTRIDSVIVLLPLPYTVFSVELLTG